LSVDYAAGEKFFIRLQVDQKKINLGTSSEERKNNIDMNISLT